MGVDPQFQDIPQAYKDAEMIRTSFFERFNFARENSHILINPVRAELAHAFQKIEQKCKNQYRKVAVFYYFLGYNEMQ